MNAVYKLIKDLLDRWHDRGAYFPEKTALRIIERRGLTSHVYMFEKFRFEKLRGWCWDIRRPETVKKHLDRMVSEGKLRSREGINATYYEVAKDDNP